MLLKTNYWSFQSGHHRETKRRDASNSTTSSTSAMLLNLLETALDYLSYTQSSRQGRRQPHQHQQNLSVSMPRMSSSDKCQTRLEHKACATHTILIASSVALLYSTAPYKQWYQTCSARPLLPATLSKTDRTLRGGSHARHYEM